MKNRTIAVTGANGFLGQHLVAKLKQEKNLSIRLFDKSKHDLFKIKKLKTFLKHVDVVIHLAGANRDNNSNLIKLNTLGTLNLLEGIAEYCPNARLIFSSSFQVYNNSGMYSLSKKFAEKLIEYYALELNIKSIILRISNIYGPGGKPFYNSVIATYVHQAKNNELLIVNGDGKQKRDYIYVEDVVEAINKCIYLTFEGNIKIFDICSGELVRINKIVNTIKKIYPNSIRIKHNPKTETNIDLNSFSKTSANKLPSWKPRTQLIDGLKLMLKN